MRLIALGLCLLSGMAYAGVTNGRGTQPETCFGAKNAEVCLDSSGNWVPQTTATQTLGTSALKFSALNVSNGGVAGAALAALSVDTTKIGLQSIDTTKLAKGTTETNKIMCARNDGSIGRCRAGSIINSDCQCDSF